MEKIKFKDISTISTVYSNELFEESSFKKIKIICFNKEIEEKFKITENIIKKFKINYNSILFSRSSSNFIENDKKYYGYIIYKNIYKIDVINDKIKSEYLYYLFKLKITNFSY